MLSTRPNYMMREGVPSIADYLRLRNEGGLSAFSSEAAREGLPNSVYAVRVMQVETVVGMGRIVGDGGCFCQIVDIVVHPSHQGRGLGAWIMDALMEHARAHLPSGTHLSLLADVPANKLYERFGFDETAPRSVAMALRI